jgi:hypothetical protein
MVEIRTTQLREHNSYYYSFPEEPDILIQKSGASELEINSFTAGDESFGEGHCFIVFKKTFLHGKTVKVRWKGNDTLGAGRYPYSIDILDGDYLRTSMSDFPNENPRATKGNGVLYNHKREAENGAWGYEEHQFVANCSGASTNYVTLFVSLHDAWVEDKALMALDYIKILDGAVEVFVNDFDDAVEMGLTGTYNDYGIIGSQWRAEIRVKEYLHLDKNMQTPSDIGGVWVCGHYLRYVRPRWDRIKDIDHNIPRTILRQIRDQIQEMF